MANREANAPSRASVRARFAQMELIMKSTDTFSPRPTQAPPSPRLISTILPAVCTAISIIACGFLQEATPTLREPEESRDPGYGLTQEYPIRVGGVDLGPARERWFLDQLRGPDGQIIQYERIGSCCEFETHAGFTGSGFLDIYEVTYPGLGTPTRLYIDMYTCDNPHPPLGFLQDSHEDAREGRLFFSWYTQFFREEIARTIFVYDAATQCLDQLALSGAGFLPFAVSPDGTAIAYSDISSEEGQILHIAELGANASRQLSEDGAWDIMPAFSPDGAQLVFVRQMEDTLNLFMQSVSGGTAAPLTQNQSANIEPAWSPNGSTIAFASDRDGDFDIYLIDSDGSDLRQLTNDPGFDGGPAWSPDGQEIVFVSDRSGDLDLYRSTSDGTDIYRIPTPGIADAFPTWSPSGAQIAFCGIFPEYSAIYVVDPDGGNLQPVTGALNSGYYPEWSR